MQYYIYVLTNWNDKVMYIGVTSDLERRLYEHKQALMDGFTKKYRVSGTWLNNTTPRLLSS